MLYHFLTDFLMVTHKEVIMIFARALEILKEECKQNQDVTESNPPTMHYPILLQRNCLQYRSDHSMIFCLAMCTLYAALHLFLCCVQELSWSRPDSNFYEALTQTHVVLNINMCFTFYAHTIHAHPSIIIYLLSFSPFLPVSHVQCSCWFVHMFNISPTYIEYNLCCAGGQRSLTIVWLQPDCNAGTKPDCPKITCMPTSWL